MTSCGVLRQPILRSRVVAATTRSCAPYAPPVDAARGLSLHCSIPAVLWDVVTPVTRRGERLFGAGHGDAYHYLGSLACGVRPGQVDRDPAAVQLLPVLLLLLAFLLLLATSAPLLAAGVAFRLRWWWRGSLVRVLRRRCLRDAWLLRQVVLRAGKLVGRAALSSTAAWLASVRTGRASLVVLHALACSVKHVIDQSLSSFVVASPPSPVIAHL